MCFDQSTGIITQAGLSMIIFSVFLEKFKTRSRASNAAAASRNAKSHEEP